MPRESNANFRYINTREEVTEYAREALEIFAEVAREQELAELVEVELFKGVFNLVAAKQIINQPMPVGAIDLDSLRRAH